VGAAKIQNGAVTGDKVADGSLSGADINAGSTPFTQVAARIRNGATLNMQSTGYTLLGTYMQAAGEDDLYLGGIDVTFSASCAPPRTAAAYLVLNPINLSELATETVIGFGVVTDKIGGTVTKRLEFGDYGVGGSGGMHRMGLPSAQNHTVYVYVGGGSCSSGSGIGGTNAGMDVLATK
jgi:hypothetical protein